MLTLQIRYLRCEAPGGSRIEDMARQAQVLADRFQLSVRFSFNGRSYHAVPNGTVHNSLDRFWRSRVR